MHSGRLAIGNSYGVGVIEDANSYYTDLIPTKAGDTFSVNKKFNWRQTVLLLYNDGVWLEYVNFEENTDGSYSATIPSSSSCNGFAISVITSDNEASSSYQMIETLMLVKGDSSNLPDEYMAYGEAKVIATVSESVLDEKLKEKIHKLDANTDNIRIKPILYGFGIIDASVGSELSIASNNYRQVYYAEIEENTGYFITFLRADYNGEYNGWCVVDSDKKVLSVSGAFQSANGSYVPPISGAKYLYYQVENDRTTTIFKDNGKFKIFDGEYTKFEAINIIKSASGEVKNTNTKFRGYDVATIIPSIDGETFTIPVDSKKYSNVGVWTRMRYKDSQNLTSLKIATNNNDGNSVSKSLFEMDSNWHLLKVQSTGGVTTDITLTLSYVDNIAIDIALCVVGDQFTRPTILLNFDQAWLASETCGLYDYLFDNNIPFTITGTINKVSEEMQAKLKRQNQNGFLDIGTYGNELYDSTYYPCSDSISDYATALRNLENVYTKKIEYAEKPISFGASGHKYTPLVTRAIKDSGYKVCKTSDNQYGINSDFDGDLITVCVSAYNGNYTPIEPTVLGCCYGFFAHGVSSSPSQEEDPTMYYEWSIVKQLLDYFKNLRDKGCVQFINMRQLYEILQNDNIN
ncbi:MAG: hypothetical protein PUG10_02020 [Lachnospiraceae bacterium]|nr:hypothetical protein [Lachnospiraceae bacterium]